MHRCRAQSGKRCDARRAWQEGGSANGSLTMLAVVDTVDGDLATPCVDAVLSSVDEAVHFDTKLASRGKQRKREHPAPACTACAHGSCTPRDSTLQPARAAASPAAAGCSS